MKGILKGKELITTLLTFLILLTILSPMNQKQTFQKKSFDEEDNSINRLRSSAEKIYVVAENLSRPMNVSESNSYDSNHPSIGIDSNDVVHITWEEYNGGDYDIYYRSYDTEMDQFSEIFDVSSSSTDNDISPDLYVDSDDNVHVVWKNTEDGDVYYRKKASSGSWDTSPSIVYASSVTPLTPSITVNDDGDLFVIWKDDNDDELYFRTDTGTGWNPIQSIIDASDKREPKVESDYNGDFHITYHNYSSGNYDIMYLPYSSGSLGENVCLTKDLRSSSLSYSAKFPDIKATNNKIYICWSDKITSGSVAQLYLNNKSLTGDFDVDYVNQLTSDASRDDTRPSLLFDSDNSDLFVLWGKYDTSDPFTGDHYLMNISGDNIYHLTEKDNLKTDSSTKRTSIAINSYGSIFCAWQGKPNDYSDIFLRKLDRYGPHLNLLNPSSNGSAISGEFEFECDITKFDFKKIRYEIYNDTNNNGLADDGNDWKIINETTNLVDLNYTWDSSVYNIRSMILNISAWDKNGLEENILRGKLIVDNIIPKRSDIIEIYDTLGHNSSKDQSRFTDHVFFRCYTEDNNSLVDKIELWGDRGTGYSLLTTNASKDLINLNSKEIVDDDYRFKIRTYDRAGNYNESEEFSVDITIDNTAPVPIIKLDEDAEVSNNDIIEIDLTSHLDANNVSYYYFPVGYPDQKKKLGSDTNRADGWNYTVNIPVGYGRITFRVNATDDTGLTSGAEVNIWVDNSPPIMTILTTFEEIGFSANINISFQKEAGEGVDVVTVAAFYREASAVNQPWLEAANITNVKVYLQSHPHNEGPNSYHVILQCEFYGVQSEWNNLDIMIKAKDNKDWTTTNTDAFKAVEIIRGAPAALSELDYQINKYNITLKWKKSSDANEYIIFQSLYNIYDKFNLDGYYLLNLTERISFIRTNLGFEPGEKYCVSRVSFQTGENATFKVKVDGPNTFHFVIIPLKSGNPGKAMYLSITVEAENPIERSVQPDQTRFFPYIFLIFLAISITMTLIQIKRIKAKYFKGRVEVETSKIIKEELAKFESDQLSLDTTIKKEEVISLKDLKKKKKEKKPLDISSFESSSIMEETEAVFEEEQKPLIDKCPTCGWILSSKSTKCPRCGWNKPD